MSITHKLIYACKRCGAKLTLTRREDESVLAFEAKALQARGHHQRFNPDKLPAPPCYDTTFSVTKEIIK